MTWVIFARAVRHPHRNTLYSFLGLAYAALLLEVSMVVPCLALEWAVLLKDLQLPWAPATCSHVIYQIHDIIIGVLLYSFSMP